MTAFLPLYAPVENSPAASLVPPVRIKRPSTTISFGKYREIIIAVALFLLFDLGVLVLNFYTSFKIDQDTVAINLAGRQRYVSQRIARTLLELDAARAAGQPYKNETLAELRNGTKVFQISHLAFREGGIVPGGDGVPVFLQAVTTPRGRQLEGNVDQLWKPYYEKLQPLVAIDNFLPEQLAAALAYSQANNSALLNLANDFVTEAQAIGASRASNLRMVQTAGILLALMNFAFILFKFLRRLQNSDAAIDAVNAENLEILASVREGLFLITPNFRLGSQLSQSAHKLFGQKLVPGADFFALLKPLVSEKTLTDARDYVELLFATHVKEALVQGINPLSAVEVQITDRLGHAARRHLSFHFNRVQQGSAIRHLLVTAQDISTRVDLEGRLKSERQRSQKEFAMLLKAVNSDPAMLRQFVTHAETSLLEINDLMRSTSTLSGEAAIGKRLDDAARRIHAIKGDAATLGLDLVAAQAHLFEDELQRVRQFGGDSGDFGSALLALPVPLEDLLSKINALKSLSGMRRPASDHGTGEAINDALAKLVADVAADSGRRARAIVRMGSQCDLEPVAAEIVREMAVQLLRNAVVHGVETPLMRRAANKPEEGRIEVSLARSETDWTLCVRDDGAGLSAARVRSRLLELGWYNSEQLKSFDDQQIISHIFKPGFSTAGSVSMHAGRGVGLDVVYTNIQKLGARLTLSSTPGKFTEFRVKFAI